MSEVSELRVDLSIYTLDAVFQAAYKFTDKAYLFLRPEGAAAIVVELRARNDAVMLADIVGLFSNELIDQRLRQSIAAETKGIRERLFAEAFRSSDFTDASA